jgi:hypothetical protein
MMTLRTAVEAMSSPEVLVATRELVKTSRRTEAELLVHLGEIDHRKLYRATAFPSMFAFCVGEYAFSEDVACSRIAAARAARVMPAILPAIESGKVHLTGLRLLLPQMTPENHRDLLQQAAGKSKREIEELVAVLAPKPPVPTLIRNVPARPSEVLQGAPLEFPHGASPLEGKPSADASAAHIPAEGAPDVSCAPRPPAAMVRYEHRSVVAPLSADTFKIQFAATRTCRDKLRRAQDLMRHRIPDGDLGTIFEKALDVLIEKVEKERFATERKPRKAAEDQEEASSRHIPDAIKRAVFERDEGRCTFTDDDERRCSETGRVEFDHVDGYARTREHRVDRIRLRCRAHNQHAAEEMYGRGFMQRARMSTKAVRNVPGTLSG